MAAAAAAGAPVVARTYRCHQHSPSVVLSISHLLVLSAKLCPETRVVPVRAARPRASSADGVQTVVPSVPTRGRPSFESSASPPSAGAPEASSNKSLTSLRTHYSPSADSLSRFLLFSEQPASSCPRAPSGGAVAESTMASGSEAPRPIAIIEQFVCQEGLMSAGAFSRFARRCI